MPAPIELLLVEDDPGDIRLAEEALKEHKMQNRVRVLRDGEESLRFLRGQGEHAGRTLPDFVLMDMNLPKIDGLEVLAQMQADPMLRDIPVAVLTASEMDREFVEKHGLSAECYIIKPLTIEKYLAALQCYSQFGLAIVRVASNDG